MQHRALLLLALASPLFAQPEVMGWGNLTGIRVDGHLRAFESSLCVLEPEGAGLTRTGKERQQTTFQRTGATVTVGTTLRPARAFREAGASWELKATQRFEATGPGAARVQLEMAAPAAAAIAGAYFCLALPAADFASAQIEAGGKKTQLILGNGERNEYLKTSAAEIRFTTPKRSLALRASAPAEMLLLDDRRHGDYSLLLLVRVLEPNPAAGAKASATFDLTTTGGADPATVSVHLDATRPGQLFAGLGGNFRLQNPKTDPQVIDYNLENLRLTYARVEMPWRFWQPQEDTDPLTAPLDARVDAAMKMAQRLARLNLPVIVSAWGAPDWAVLGDTRARRPEGAPMGNPLNPEKLAKIHESLANYLVVLKQRYGVEAVSFSFNESDLGINVRQTPAEHARLIRELGRLLAAKGLATRMLLGDTSDADPVEFVDAALADAEAVKYISAVSFHSWRGCTVENLRRWRSAARAINVPLLVGEGSTDAAAWRYAQVFDEQSFALYEIDLYLRILTVAQPLSILQWQLTADYSLLAGGGIFGDNGPLRPTRRFFNLKQLAETPANSFALPVSASSDRVTAAAFGDISGGRYTVHLVNHGARAQATLTGLPLGLKELKVWLTDSTHNRQELTAVPVNGGAATLPLEATSFTTVLGVVPR